MDTKVILGVPFFCRESAKEKFGAEIPDQTHFTDIGASQVFITYVYSSDALRVLCLIKVEGSDVHFSGIADTAEEAIQNTLDQMRDKIGTNDKVKHALLECYSTFTIPTRKSRISLAPPK